MENPIENKILYTSFNNNNSLFAIGTETGFQIYKSSPFELKIDKGRFFFYFP